MIHYTKPQKFFGFLFLFEFNSIHIRALLVKIPENTNKCTILQYIFFTTGALEQDNR
jgi:hypothetical protein